MINNKICFVTKDILPLLVEEEKSISYGGSEVKVFNTAQELQRYNYKISFIGNSSHSLGETFRINGFDFFPWTNPSIQIKYLKTIKFYLSLWKMLKSANADYYISQNANVIIFIVALFSKLHHKNFIHWVSHYNDTLKFNKKGMRGIDFVLFKIGSKLAAITIAQTEEQKISLRKNRDIESIVIRNGHRILEDNELVQVEKKYILWVGRIKKSKQPHLLFEIAEHFPQYLFKILGEFGEEDPDYVERIKKLLNNSKNVIYDGHVQYDKISKYYKEAFFLVSTSLGEGFSNTFIEAWNHCIPVISLNIDPDDCIKKYDLGFYSGSIESIISDIKLLFNDEETRIRKGINGRKYIQQFHDIKITANQFIKVLETVN